MNRLGRPRGSVHYDAAIESSEYVKELALHHVGGHLNIA
jgi:hypothetical protein